MELDEIKEGVLDILEELHADVDYETEEALVDGKILDSFDLVTLVTELSEEFDVDITAKDFVPDNFNSAKRLVNMIARLMDE